MTFILQKWAQAQDKMIKGIQMYNTQDKDKMVLGFQQAKSSLIQFIQYLKHESENIKGAFKSKQQYYITQIQKMSKGIQIMKKNLGKPKNKQIKEGLDSFEYSLLQVIVRQKPNVKWTDIAGLQKAKQALQEAVILPIRFPQIFTGERKPWKGILLYGPPGTGKTYLAKACANEMEKGTFFSISSSDIMSKYVGQSQKVVKTLFQMARKQKPSIIFIDEIDSMTGSRSDGDNQASRRVKTQFLIQMQGIRSQDQGILVLGATNMPWTLDPAVRRRFQRRIYIPLPELKAREILLKKLCQKTPNILDDEEFSDLAKRTEGFSGSDISILVRDAAYEPLRISQNAVKFKKTKNEKGQDAWTPVPPSQNEPGEQYTQTKMQKLVGKIVLPDLEYQHFLAALVKCKPSVSSNDLHKYVKFTQDYGQDG